MKSRIASHAVAFTLGGLVGLAAIALLSSKTVDPLPSQSERSLASPPAVSIPQVPLAAEASASKPRASVETFHERVATAFAHESKRRKAWEIERLFEDMTPGTAPSILALIRESGIPEYGALAGPFFAKWGEIDGPTALAAAKLLEGEEKKSAIKTVFNSWARLDLHAAWDVAQVYLDDPNGRMANLARGVLAEMAKQDPDSLMRLVASDAKHHLNGTIADKLLEAAFELGEQEKLLQRLSIFEDTNVRNLWTKNIYRKWGELDSDEALDSLATIEDQSDAGMALTGFLQGLSRSDPMGALEYAIENPANPAVEESITTIAYGAFREINPQESEALIQRIADAGLLDKTASMIGNTLANKDPQAAIRFSEKLSNEEQRLQVMGFALSSLANTDFEAARSYYDQLPSAGTKVKLLDPLTRQLYQRKDGGAQLVELLDTVPPSRERSQVIELLLHNASYIGPQSTKDFMAGLKQAADSDPNLSEHGQALRSKIFGDE